MDQPTEATADQAMQMVEKAAQTLRVVADQSLALFVVNAALIRALYKAGHVDMVALGEEVARLHPHLNPDVLRHVNALTSVSTSPAPSPPPTPPYTRSPHS